MNYFDVHKAFFDKVRKSSPKKRTCLKCGTEFLSNSISHRICAVCAISNSHYGLTATKTVRINTNMIKKTKDND